MNCIFSDEIEISLNKRESITVKLKEKNLLCYGALIECYQISEIFETDKLKESEKEWNFIVLHLMQVINSFGFFTTTRGRQGAVYILEPEEMPSYNENQNRLAYKNLNRRQRGLNMIDPSVLDESQKKKLEFEVLRNGHLQLQMATKLKERCRF